MSNKLPRWDELPTIDLYLDQVLEFVNQQLSLYFQHISVQPLSASMVNNYVKHKHIEKPIKKRYSRHHIADLITISLLKHVFAIQDLSNTVSRLSQEYQKDTLYNMFISCLEEDTIDTALPLISAACQTLSWYKKTRIISKQERL